MTFSPADHLAALTRRVSSVTRDDEQLRLVTVSRTYAATPDEVWDALVTPDRIERWLAPVTGTFEVGGTYKVEGNAGGEILACDRPDRLSVTWVFADVPSWVDVSLRPTDDGTLLQLDHALLENDHWRMFGPGATGIGWEMMMLGLVLHLDSPDAPRPAPEELPDFSDYFTASGTAWGEADAADGADPAEAAAAARRCVAAYRGEPMPED